MESEKRSTSPAEESTLSAILADDLSLLDLDRSCVRSLDLTVLPITAAYYLLSFVDRSNIGARLRWRTRWGQRLITHLVSRKRVGEQRSFRGMSKGMACPSPSGGVRREERS